MSLISVFQPKAGSPLIIDLQALRAAALRLGLTMRLPEATGLGVATHPQTGKTYSAVLNRDGTAAQADMSYRTDNRAEARYAPRAACVLTQTDNPNGYEIGIVPDQANPGAYTIVFDTYGGEDLRKKVGNSFYANDEAVIAPLLIQWYKMECDRIVAAENGDEIEFEQQPDNSWVAIVNTEARLGV